MSALQVDFGPEAAQEFVEPRVPPVPETMEDTG